MIRLKSLCVFFYIFVSAGAVAQPIDRRVLVQRNAPVVTSMDTLSSLTVGNGDFAFTADATGLQTFPEYYAKGVCLGTQSTWGWHSFPNDKGLTIDETFKEYDFGHHSGLKELYACQFKEQGRKHDASEYFRINPHRLHLGAFGFEVENPLDVEQIDNIHQRLDMWDGVLRSSFSMSNTRYKVSTVCHPSRSMIAARIVNESGGAVQPLVLRLPYPTGAHTDDACDWRSVAKHHSCIYEKGDDYAVVKHELDSTTYFVVMSWVGKAQVKEKVLHTFTIIPEDDSIDLTVEYVPEYEGIRKDCHLSYTDVQLMSSDSWNKFWTEGAAVDFSLCKDERARELERRVVQSQYLLALQSAGSMPPQETGLTMNSWFGKFHLEMILWHQAWLPLWGHGDKLANTLNWYFDAEPIASGIASRQGFEGVRWMKMTDPSGIEAPSNVGSFLIWQQPHIIYLSELVRRGLDEKQAHDAFVSKMYPLINKTAQFMGAFATHDSMANRYILKGYIPAQESLKADVTYNSPYELNQWLYTMSVAQHWRELMNDSCVEKWNEIIEGLSPLAYNADSLYLAAESAVDTYSNVKMTSDHPALLGALGFYPDSRLINKDVMNNTLDWIVDNWNWPSSWGWDFPMTAMTATRLHQPDKAINALMMHVQKNTYLNNGHNYQDSRLRIYLPGNGGLLSAIALMCAGWDGCDVSTPGFPKDGNWDVRWEGLSPMP